VPALEDVDDSLPGIRLFGIGREKEGQCIVIIGTTCGRPHRQRRRAQRAGAT
jgi:hypothetical protein